MPGLISWWKPIGIVVVVLAARYMWVSYGTERFNAGYAQAQAENKQAEEKLKAQHEREKQINEREAQQRSDQARSDALAAANTAGRLQQQLVAIRKQLRQYSATIGAGTPAADTGILLTNLFEKSLERNRQLAEYADRAAAAGRVCEQQYDSLTKQSTLPQ